MAEEIAKLQERIQELEEENEMNIAQIEEQAEMYQAKEAECEELLAKLENRDAAAFSGPCKDCEELKAQIPRLEAIQKECAELKSEIIEKNDQLKQSRQMVSGLEKELSEMKNSCGGFNEQLQEQKKENDRLTKEKNAHQEKLQNLQLRFEEVGKEIEVERTAKSQVEQKLSQTEALLETSISKQEQAVLEVQKLSAENKNLQESLCALKAQSTDAAQYLDQIQTLRQQLADQMMQTDNEKQNFKAREEAMEKKLKEADEKLSQLKDLLLEKEERIKVAQKINEMESCETAELRQKLDEAYTLNFELQKRICK